MVRTWGSLALAGALVCTAAAAKAQSGWQPSVMSVRVSPGESQLRPGQRLNLVVSAFDASGAPLDGLHVAYSTSDPHVATIADDGLVLAVAPGRATITAQIGTGPGARSGRSQVRVMGEVQSSTAAGWTPSIRSVLLTPASGRIHVGEQIQLRARAQDMSNDDLPFVPVVYTSGDVHIATVSDDGLVSGISPGKVSITARVGNGPGARSASTAIEVLPAGP